MKYVCAAPTASTTPSAARDSGTAGPLSSADNPNASAPGENAKHERPRSTPLRTSVLTPMGSADKAPKHWQAGLAPRSSVRAMTTVNNASRSTAPSAAKGAVRVGSSAAARISSRLGSATASAGVSATGAAKAISVCWNTARCRNFAMPATANTAASSRRADRETINTSVG